MVEYRVFQYRGCFQRWASWCLFTKQTKLYAGISIILDGLFCFLPKYHLSMIKSGKLRTALFIIVLLNSSIG